MTLCSPDYEQLLKQRYEAAGWGKAGASHIELIMPWLLELGASSVLDYGCGRGTLKSSLEVQLPGVAVHEYDPGVVGKDAPPAPVDLLVCTDVLEHVEPECLDAILIHMKKLARRGMYLSINCGFAKERDNLPDGRNAHLIVQKAAWWIETIRRHGIEIVRDQRKKGVRLWTIVQR